MTTGEFIFDCFRVSRKFGEAIGGEENEDEVDCEGTKTRCDRVRTGAGVEDLAKAREEFLTCRISLV